MDLSGFVDPPSIVRQFAAKQHADLHILVLLGQRQAMDIEPVMLNGLNLGVVEVCTQIHPIGPALQGAPDHQSGPGIGRLG